MTGGTCGVSAEWYHKADIKVAPMRGEAKIGRRTDAFFVEYGEKAVFALRALTLSAGSDIITVEHSSTRL